MNWHLKSFDNLSLQELYNLMTLRQVVFVVEQDCPYVDADGKDPFAHHLFAVDTEGICACTRLLAPGISYPTYSSIGRVVTAERVRRTGLGRELMRRSIIACRELFPGAPIKISAQCYLDDFYKVLGFRSTGEEYLEDGIPHQGMVLREP